VADVPKGGAVSVRPPAEEPEGVPSYAPCAIVAVTAVLFGLAAWFGTPWLVTRIGWLAVGHAFFGLTVGLMVGMTRSAVVSGVLPLLFAFAGGTVVALSIGYSEEELRIIGRQLATFGAGTILGIFVGVTLKQLKVDLPLGKFRD
jgi:hypothetical protein